jgi:hypothetical protein
MLSMFCLSFLKMHTTLAHATPPFVSQDSCRIAPLVITPPKSAAPLSSLPKTERRPVWRSKFPMLDKCGVVQRCVGQGD